MNAIPCPFCGLATDLPHETQQACIDALHAEIARVRGILDYAKEPGSKGRRRTDPSEDDAEDDEPGGVLDEARVRTKDAASIV